MNDIKLIIDTSLDKEWDLDINIKDGWFEELPYANQTQEQRAAVAAYITLGSIPGHLDEGTDWTSYLQDKNNIVTIDNQIKQSIQSVVTYDTDKNLTQSTFTPVYIPDDASGQCKVYILKG